MAAEGKELFPELRNLKGGKKQAFIKKHRDLIVALNEARGLTYPIGSTAKRKVGPSTLGRSSRLFLSRPGASRQPGLRRLSHRNPSRKRGRDG